MRSIEGRRLMSVIWGDFPDLIIRPEKENRRRLHWALWLLLAFVVGFTLGYWHAASLVTAQLQQVLRLYLLLSLRLA